MLARVRRLTIARARERLALASGRLSHAAGTVLRPEAPAIRSSHPEAAASSPVESYWSGHTVPALTLWTRRASRRQLEERFRQYPLFRELSGLWGRHDGEVLLDYGCGPGNDLVGFALYTGARKIIGIDVSQKALAIAADRLALHRVDPARVELILGRDTEHTIPLEDGSVDYFQSQGVLHHISEPRLALRELHRVLKPGGAACVMVYNRDSIWRHLYVAYVLMLRDGAFEGLDIDEAFARSTDGPDCPIARNYEGPEFAALCETAGFKAEYLGGYLSRLELQALAEFREEAVADERLAPEHRDFLAALSFDSRGYPTDHGKYAGIGGTYRLRRPRG